jgi:hypothetical protein
MNPLGDACLYCLIRIGVSSYDDVVDVSYFIRESSTIRGGVTIFSVSTIIPDWRTHAEIR